MEDIKKDFIPEKSINIYQSNKSQDIKTDNQSYGFSKYINVDQEKKDSKIYINNKANSNAINKSEYSNISNSNFDPNFYSNNNYNKIFNNDEEIEFNFDDNNINNNIKNDISDYLINKKKFNI